jgi:hypothetical protein
MLFRDTLQLELQPLHEEVAGQNIVAVGQHIEELGSVLVWGIAVVGGSLRAGMAVALVILD